MEAAIDTLGAAQLETIPKFPYLVAAYGAFFVILLIYVITLQRRERDIARRVEALERRLD